MYKYRHIHSYLGVFAMNIALFTTIFSIAFTVLIGVLMIILFVNELDKPLYVFGAVGVGTLLSLPISFVVTKKLSTLGNDNK